MGNNYYNRPTRSLIAQLAGLDSMQTYLLGDTHRNVAVSFACYGADKRAALTDATEWLFCISQPLGLKLKLKSIHEKKKRALILTHCCYFFYRRHDTLIHCAWYRAISRFRFDGSVNDTPGLPYSPALFFARSIAICIKASYKQHLPMITYTFTYTHPIEPEHPFVIHAGNLVC